MAVDNSLHIAVELAGTGLHPMAWRLPDSEADRIYTARYWMRLLQTAEQIGIDLALLPDSFVLQPGGTSVQRGRLDAVAIAAYAAPMTSSIGLVPVVSVTHTEPFHIAKAIATLDHISGGRGGWQAEVADGSGEYQLFGRKPCQESEVEWAEAAEFVDLVTRLWDSWEDDAVIRDIASGRYLDRAKVHHVDFTGEFFQVKGPLITPRPPQGHPLVVKYAASRSSRIPADLVRISASSFAEAEATAAAHRSVGSRVLIDLDVLLGDSRAAADREFGWLQQWAGEEYQTRSLLHVGTASGLTELLDRLRESRNIDGVTLRPLALASTLAELPVVSAPHGGTLRERLGLPRPENPNSRKVEVGANHA